MGEEGESEPEFEAILDRVDPNRGMFISLQDYMGFMISKETENVATSDEIVNAFQSHHHPGARVHPQEGALRPLVQGDGGLLRQQDETLLRPQDWRASCRSLRLHGVHQDSVPDVIQQRCQHRWPTAKGPKLYIVNAAILY